MPSDSTSHGDDDAADLADRRAGSLLGQALGDALGFVVETCDGAHCTAYWASLSLDRWPAPPGGHRRGQYSDDTQLARELTQSCVDCCGFDPADYAARVARLFATGAVVGGRAATREAAERLAAGVPWSAAGTPAPAAGNGSAMRAAPIGLLHGPQADAARLCADAMDQGRITHADPRCVAGSIAIAGATAMCLRDAPREAEPFCEVLATWTQPHDPPLARALRELPVWRRLPPREVLARVHAVGELPAYAAGWHGVSAFVTHSVLWALYALLRTPDDPWAVLGTAISVGGDVDTTAAMAGAMVGAAHGRAAWPADFLAQLHDGGGHGATALADLAAALGSAR